MRSLAPVVLLALAGCGVCGDGHVRGSDGECYAIVGPWTDDSDLPDTDAEDTDDTDGDADTDADGDTDVDTDVDTDADADADGDSDADTDTDSDADTDTDPSPEDCGNGADDDLDGLIDCEDGDCVDLCMEDCRDGFDNDADGLVDCADDECVADPACDPSGARYDVSMKVSFEPMALYYGELLENYVSYQAIAIGYGQVYLLAEPTDSSFEAFSCSGQLNVGPTEYWDYAGLTYEGTGSCDGCDYRFRFEPTVATGSLAWGSSCPIEDLPPTHLGFHVGERYITQAYGSGWRMQYRGDASWYYYGEYGLGRGYFYEVEPASERTFTWYAP